MHEQSEGDSRIGSSDGTTARVRLASQADAAAWDSYVSTHPLATAYHRWAYKTALEASYGLKTLYVMAEDEDGVIKGVLPAARMRSLKGATQLCALPYCDRGEALVDSPGVDRELVSWLSQQTGLPVEVRGTSDSDAPLTGDAADGLIPGQKVRMVLALPESSEALLAGFKSKHRSQINKARKNGLVSSVGPGLDRVSSFYDVFTRNMRDLGSPTHARKWFRAIADDYGEDCLIGLVTLDERVVGAGIVLTNGNTAVVPWASTLREYNRLAPNMLLYWSLIEAAMQRGCRQFDFGRSGYQEGTYRFKAQWGAHPIPLRWFRHGACSSEESATPGQSNSARVALAWVWRRLPLPLSVALGSRLRPLISL
ncbi:MAG: GNAT family N-acetyltransferase [Pseudomonadota bacterium]